MTPITRPGFGNLSLSLELYGSPDDPGVVLLHSGGQTAAVWRETAEALAAAGRHVVCPDLRGHGASARPADGRYDLEAYVEDLRAILRSLPTRPVVVGAALGGAIALAALSGSDGALATGLVVAGIAPALDRTAVRALARQGRGNGCTDPRWAGGLDLDGLERDLDRSLGDMKLPLLVMQGSETVVLAPGALEAMRRRAPSATFIEIEGGAHRVATERPEVFQARLLEFLERHAPREPLAYHAGSDARTLRDALGCFGTGVTIVTTRTPEGAAVGLTANSFTSVSLDPPLLLFCLARSAGSLAAFEACDHFAVNVLHIGQQPTSDRFARRTEDRFETTAFEDWGGGPPILSGSLASFLCRKHATHDGGDHRIFIGEVMRARYEPRRDPLLYFGGRYRRLHFA